MGFGVFAGIYPVKISKFIDLKEGFPLIVLSAYSKKVKHFAEIRLYWDDLKYYYYYYIPLTDPNIVLSNYYHYYIGMSPLTNHDIIIVYNSSDHMVVS